ncbi:MAG: hypothetical protein LH606_21390 [Cytophagaceae bacterium]|nr:hypothetical protein [Cytophagaceae bacterium]
MVGLYGLVFAVRYSGLVTQGSFWDDILLNGILVAIPLVWYPLFYRRIR